MNGGPPPDWNPPDDWLPPEHRQTPPRARGPRSQWSAAGIELAVIAAVGGLAILGSVVVLFVILSSGNFKLGNK